MIEARVAPTEDPRLPMPGTRSGPPLPRQGHRRARPGGRLRVRRPDPPLPEFGGREATGTPWNGFAFFGLGGRPGRKHGSNE